MDENDEIIRDIKAFNSKWLAENEPNGHQMCADYTSHLIKRWYDKKLDHKIMGQKLTVLYKTMLKKKYTKAEVDKIFINGHRIWR